MKLSREFIENKIKWWEMVLAVWDRCEVKKGDSANTAACKLYVRMQTTQGLRTELTRRGYRLPYTLKTSDLIILGDVPDRDLARVARELFKANKEHERIK